MVSYNNKPMLYYCIYSDTVYIQSFEYILL